MNTLAVLTEARDAAQNELTQAEVALLEATVRAEEAREAARRLEAAVAALNGETSAPPGPPDNGRESAEGRQSGSRPDPTPNPYGHLKCTGCGTKGNMVPGAHGMMVCQTCGNMLG